MEKVRKGYEILDEMISPDNVMRIGELLALSALKFMCGHKMLHRMYANLARDIDYKNLNGYVLTDSYDLAQEAALFLCGYMGKSVFDTCIDPKSGKTYAKGECAVRYSVINCTRNGKSNGIPKVQKIYTEAKSLLQTSNRTKKRTIQSTMR